MAAGEAKAPRMIAAIPGIGPKHIQPTVTLIIPNIIAATLRLLFGGKA